MSVNRSRLSLVPSCAVRLVNSMSFISSCSSLAVQWSLDNEEYLIGLAHVVRPGFNGPVSWQGIAAVMEFGAVKYGVASWRNVEAVKFRDSAYRHLAACGLDEESGLAHEWHVGANLLILLCKQRAF